MDDDRVLAALEADPGPFLARWISLMGVAARGHYPHREVPVEETVARLIGINELVITLSAHLDSLRLEPPYSATRTVKALNATCGS